MSETVKRLIRISNLVMVALIVTVGSSSGQRPCCQRQLWLQWKESQRETFVNAYTFGYLAGLNKGCETGVQYPQGQVESRSQVERLRQCRDSSVDFSKGTDYLVKAITDFYDRYPGDDDIRPDEVLEQIGRGLTPEQIHRYPFWRRAKAQ